MGDGADSRNGFDSGVVPSLSIGVVVGGAFQRIFHRLILADELAPVFGQVRKSMSKSIAAFVGVGRERSSLDFKAQPVCQNALGGGKPRPTYCASFVSTTLAIACSSGTATT